jgi:PAS domain S-box-containing protein
VSRAENDLIERLSIVSQTARATSAESSVDALMPRVYEAVGRFFDHEAFMVFRYLPTTDVLTLYFGVEGGEPMERAEVSLDGYAGVVIRTGAPLYVPDVSAPNPSLPKPVAYGKPTAVRSWLGIPIQLRHQTRGVLALAAEPSDAYGEDDALLLSIVADQLAVAIENARLFVSTRAQAERFALLNRVSRAVSTTLDLAELLEGVYREIASLFDHDSFLVVLNRPATKEIELLFAIEEGARVPPLRHPFGGLSGHVIAQRATLHVRDYEAEQEHLPIPYSTDDDGTMPSSWLGVPLIARGNVLGAMCIMIDRAHAYSDERQELFEALADQIAFAIRNTELFRSTQEAADRLGIVNRIGRLVGREYDLQKLGEIVYREIAPVFEADTFFIALINEEEETIEFPFMIDEGVRMPSPAIAIGEGLTTTVFRTKKTLHVHNSNEYGAITGTPALFGSMRAPETWLGIPLIVEGRVIGVINVQSYKPHAYSDEQTLLLATIADQIAMSFEKAKLFRAAQREIEERTLAEARLASERTLLRTIIDNIPDFIYAKDSETRFVVASTAIARFFGYENPQDVLGKTLEDLLPRQEAVAYLAEEEQILETGEPLLNKEENVIDHSTDTSRWLLVTKLPLTDAEGKVIGLVGIDRDITARKRAEQEVQRYLAEVEVANEEVKQFAYIVSHDLRAPLVNLKGFSAELQDAMQTLAPHLQRMIESADDAERAELAMLLEEDIPEALGFIETSVTRMDGFINAVLKLSRLGRRELSLRPVDPSAFVETCRQSLAHQMEERSVELTVGDLPEVVADPTALEQIIGNLLTNAVNYLDPERPGRIEIGGERTNLCTRFWIKDNGRGIAKEDEEKVFAPFRRAGKQNVVGEGMGLSYVRTMVRQHGGQIWFESEPNVGTTFFFTIADQAQKGPTDG